VSEVYGVHVHLHDLVLGEELFHPDGEDELLDLSLHRPLLREKEVTGELLRDGAAALFHPLIREIFEQRPDDGGDAKPPVLVKG
jgi:dephospho-CoA kinase